MSLMFFLFIFLFIFVALLLSVFVLMQESKSLGFGASFGGDSSSSLFGSSTATIVKKITSYLIASFIIGCLISSYWSHSLSKTPKAPEVQIESIDSSK
jgi:preprotein translocase subunit SecG